MATYVDTSALVKLVVFESSTNSLMDWLAAEPRQLVACDLVRTELLRAVRRAAPERVQLAREVLESLILIRVKPAVFEQAARLEPVELRSLDAIHLAAALDLGDDLESILTYDERLASAATFNGIAVVAPA